MTLNQLSYFYQAAVLEHFNQAAEKMNITEPSLSRSIAALEDELGVTLFEKRGRNVILTKAGEIFLEHVSTILDDVKRAENKMHQIATDGGHIDIAYVSPLAKVFIPTIVRSFLTEKENKNITFNFFQDITSVNIDGLKKGRYLFCNRDTHLFCHKLFNSYFLSYSIILHNYFYKINSCTQPQWNNCTIVNNLQGFINYT